MSQERPNSPKQNPLSQRWAIVLGVVTVVSVIIAIGTSVVGIQAGQAASTATVAQGAALYAQGTAQAQADRAQKAAASATLAQGLAQDNAATATSEQGKALNAAATATILQGAALYAQSTAVAQATSAAASQATSQDEAQIAQTQAAIANMTVVPIPATLTAMASQIAAAQTKQDIAEQLAKASLKLTGGQNSYAQRIIDNLVEKYPNESAAYVARAKIYTQLGLTGQAIADFNTAIKIDPSNAQAYFNRGW